MLELDADLEGDLGIDSIKRVEIAGTFTQGLGEDERSAIDLEELTASRTLTGVIDTLEAALGKAPATATAGTGPSPGGDQRPFEQGPAEEERIGRFVVQAVSAPAITTTAGLAGSGAMVIVDDEHRCGGRAGPGSASAGASLSYGSRAGNSRGTPSRPACSRQPCATGAGRRR